MNAPPAEGNFCDELGNAIKPAIVGGLQHAYGIC
jgi:hypothetical protein